METYDFFVRMLARNYVIGSAVAVFSVGGALIFSTLQITQFEQKVFLGILLISLVIMLSIETFAFLRHLAPIRNLFQLAHPSLDNIQKVYLHTHRFPVITVKRTLGPHLLGMAIPALTMVSWCIYKGYLHLPNGYQLVGLGALCSFLVASMHGMIEYFLTSGAIQPVLNSLRKMAQEMYGVELSLEGRVLVSIRTKFLFSAILIGSLPMLLFSLATQVYLDRGTNSVVSVGLSLSNPATGISNDYWKWAGAILIVGVGFASLAAWLLYSAVQHPINQLQGNMKKVQDGEFLVRASDIYSDEFSRLVAGFNHMVKGLQERDDLNAQLLDSYFSTLAAALDARDPYTAGHSVRVAKYSILIGQKAGLSPSELNLLRKSALLHDIGKIGVRDSILLKDGRLTDEEFDLMKLHPVLGEAILKQVQPEEAMAPLLPGVRSHHERYDGRGYPDGLQGLNIPIQGRIMAVADAFDAMTSDRPYRKGMPYRKALSILDEGKGTQWDPLFAQLFIDEMQLSLVDEGEVVGAY